MLDPIQNYALRLCLGAYRTSPSSSLCALANEPPLYIRRRKLSIQYCLKLSSPPQNPTYNTVFNCKFKDLFELKPNQIPPLSIRVQPDLRAVGFVKRYALIYSIPATPPWLLKRPHINYNIHYSSKDNTSSEIYINKLFEFCDHYKDIISEQEWQDIWDCCEGNKLHSIYPTVGIVKHSKNISRYDSACSTDCELVILVSLIHTY